MKMQLTSTVCLFLVSCSVPAFSFHMPCGSPGGSSRQYFAGKARIVRRPAYSFERNWKELHFVKSRTMFEPTKLYSADAVNENMNESIERDGEKGENDVSSSSGVNMEALISMSLLALQFGIQPGLVRSFIPQSTCKSSIVLSQDFFKFFFAAIGFYASGKETRSKALKGTSRSQFNVFLRKTCLSF